MSTHSRHLIPKLSAALAATVLAASPALTVSSPTPGVTGPGRESRKRVIRKLNWPGEPVEVEEVKVRGKAVALGAQFSEEDDWLSGLTVKVRNVSDQPVLFLDVALNFPRRGSQEPEARDHLLYGRYPLPPGEAAPESPAAGQPPILPGETAELALNDYEGTRRFLDQTNYPGAVTDLEIEISDVYFDRDAKWSGGQIFRRDPDNPHGWIGERGLRRVSNIKPSRDDRVVGGCQRTLP